MSMGKLVFGLSWIFFVHSHHEGSFACLFFLSLGRASDVLVLQQLTCTLCAGNSFFGEK